MLIKTPVHINCYGGEKNMKKTQALALLTIMAIGLGGVSYAWMGSMSDMTDDERAAFQEQVQAAIEGGDYENWLSLMQERFARMTSTENFEQIQEMGGIRAQKKGGCMHRTGEDMSMCSGCRWNAE